MTNSTTEREMAEGGERRYLIMIIYLDNTS